MRDGADKGKFTLISILRLSSILFIAAGLGNNNLLHDNVSNDEKAQSDQKLHILFICPVVQLGG